MVKDLYLLIITLNTNGLSFPTRRQSLDEWIKKQDSYICCQQKIHLKPRDTNRLKARGWKKIFHANGDQKKTGVAILISDKIGFEINNMIRDKEGHYIMIKGSTPKYRTLINIDADIIGAPQYVRLMLTSIKGEINSNTIIMGGLNTSLTPMDRSTK